MIIRIVRDSKVLSLPQQQIKPETVKKVSNYFTEYIHQLSSLSRIITLNTGTYIHGMFLANN